VSSSLLLSHRVETMNEGLYLCRPHLPAYVFRVTRRKIIAQRAIMPEISFMSNLDVVGPNWRFDLRRFALGVLVFFIGCACLTILRPFLASITWAAILAYGSWPLYRVVRRPFGRFQNSAAFCMTVLLTCAVILPILWLSVLVSSELIYAYRSLAAYLAEKPAILPDFIHRIPWLGEQAQQQIDQLSGGPAVLSSQMAGWIQSWASEITAMLGGVGRSIGKLLIVMFTLFFFYRDGESIRRQCRLVVTKLFGNRLDTYVNTAGAMTRAVLYGFLITAFAQGLIAGVGYAILGLHGSVLLGAVTGVLSVVPILGTALVWGPLGAYLLITGHIWKGIILLMWGLLLVHPTDNVLRPLLISNATHVPFIIVMFGVIGGVAASGLVGAFVGPVVLALGLAIWRSWASGDEAMNALAVEGRRE
jgi:predicted PurR-regulated permease PerM